jgi:FtsH-binding integral membrane protein
MVYLAINELAILLYCFLTKNARIMLAVGFFLILLIGSLEFYAEINAIEFDQNLRLFFLYTGISHLVYGFIEIEKISPTQTNNEPK